jgi:hypothetical protein
MQFHDEGHGFDVFGLEPRAVELGMPFYRRCFHVAKQAAAN